MHTPIPTLILNYNLQLQQSHTQLDSLTPTIIITLTLNCILQLQQS